MEKAGQLYPDLLCCEDPYEAAAGADAAVLMTEWNEFRNIDLPRIRAALRAPRFLDCRNVYDPRTMQEAGFEYISVGRPPRRPGQSEPDDLARWSRSGAYLPFRA
jgi:UDPglucose 6-dehydrogenase